jgi:hypothetical protein
VSISAHIAHPGWRDVSMRQAVGLQGNSNAFS